jgi:hypothetical protein
MVLLYKKLAILSLLLLVIAGCSGDESTTGPSVADLSSGWSLYESGDNVGATTVFTAVIASDIQNAEAHNALGWAATQIGNTEQGKLEFLKAIECGMTTAAPYAGLAFALMDIAPADFHGAISSALTALEISPEWVFAHRTSLDWRDIRLVLAISYFAIHDFDSANQQVEILGGTQSSDTETLMNEITRLGDLYAG